MNNVRKISFICLLFFILIFILNITTTNDSAVSITILIFIIITTLILFSNMLYWYLRHTYRIQPIRTDVINPIYRNNLII
jgi:hypothetical protein